MIRAARGNAGIQRLSGSSSDSFPWPTSCMIVAVTNVLVMLAIEKTVFGSTGCGFGESEAFPAVPIQFVPPGSRIAAEMPGRW